MRATSVPLLIRVTIVFHLSANEKGPGSFPMALTVDLERDSPGPSPEPHNLHVFMDQSFIHPHTAHSLLRARAWGPVSPLPTSAALQRRTLFLLSLCMHAAPVLVWEQLLPSREGPQPEESEHSPPTPSRAGWILQDSLTMSNTVLICCSRPLGKQGLCLLSSGALCGAPSA